MSIPDVLAVLAGITTLIGAIAAMFVQIRRLEHRVDGRLTELLALTRRSAHAEGAKEVSDSLGVIVPRLGDNDAAGPVQDELEAERPAND